MIAEIKPGKGKGVIEAPPSKSMAHRLLISASFADGVSRVRGISKCEDVLATIDCLNAIGIKTEISGNDVTVYGKNYSDVKPEAPLRCRESGSTLRFMIPPLLLSKNTAVFYGAKSLMQRPMEIYSELCREKGLDYISDGESIVVRGPLSSGEFKLRGNVSSQFISGLLFALPTVKGDSVIKITSSVESRSYINLTIQAIKEFGIEAYWEDDYTIRIPGGQKYKATDVIVEGDYSGAVFPDSLNLFGGEVKLLGLKEDSIQGDRVYPKHFSALSRGVPTIHIGDSPDLAPMLFAIASAKCGGVFDGPRRLKIRESDRASAMAEELKKFGSSVTVYDDTVVIYPKEFHAPTESLFGHNDHRIVMALSILLTVTGGEIEGAEAITKSYPDFFRDLRSLGIEVTEYDT